MDGRPLVFRASPLSVLFAVAFVVCATPVALTVPGMAVLYLVPIGLVFWVWRVRTTVDEESIVARGALRTRRVAWREVTSLRLRTRSRVSAVLNGGMELPLPAVHTRDLPLLAKASGGRLPDLTRPPDAGPEPRRDAQPQRGESPSTPPAPSPAPSAAARAGAPAESRTARPNEARDESRTARSARSSGPSAPTKDEHAAPSARPAPSEE